MYLSNKIECMVVLRGRQACIGRPLVVFDSNNDNDSNNNDNNSNNYSNNDNNNNNARY